MKPSKEIITAFKQGGTGNCVSIAIIKAGIEIFGLNNVLSETKTENGYELLMRDGFKTSITNEELIQAAEKSLFEPGTNNAFLDYANLLFAAMAKRAQEEANDNQQNMSFEQATDTLNDGEYYLEGPHWLGLAQHVKNVGKKHCWQYPGVVRASRAHCAFVTYGIQDDHGNPKALGWIVSKFFRYFRVVSEPVV